MQMNYIIESLLDTDWYKINMQRVYLKHFNDGTGKFVFKCRSPGVVFTQEMVDEMNRQFDHLCTLRFTPEEIAFVASISYHKNARGFHEFLRLFQLNRSYLHCSLNDDGTLNLYAEGPIWAISPFEIYCLSIVNEVYFFHKYRDTYLDLCKTLSERTDAKIRKWMCAGGSILMDPFTLNEFGTRRRFMRDAQGIIIDRLAVAGEKYFFGTSNPMWAMKKGLRPIGTFAHEFVCYCQALNDCTLSNSQRYAWNVWQREYHAALGICLTDTLGQEKFEKDFDPYWANLFTGCRHDSGDPIEWGDRLLDIYRSFNIDPRSKTLMFSDSLDFDKAQKIQDHFYDKCKISFGIGTYLTNDTGVEPLNIVMKLQEANGKPVAKLSNVSGKTMCGDDKYVEYLKWAISQ